MHRVDAMQYVVEINDLEISKKHDLVLQEQDGYVSPPLVGIWARWPYFHNNAAPTLCAVLSPAEDRPLTYAWGRVRDPKLDFDADCNGFTAQPREHFEHTHDTTLEGLSNIGHDRDIFIVNGEEVFSPADKRDLIRFLQTL
jgi:hypothetical protein